MFNSQPSGGGVLIHDSADRVPPAPAGQHALRPISGAEFDRASGRRWPAQVWLLVSIVAVAPVALFLYAVWTIASQFADRYPWIVDVLGATGASVLIVAMVSGAAGLVQWLRVSLARHRLIRSRLGVPVDALSSLNIAPAVAEAAHIQLETIRAQYSQYPNLSTYSQAAQPPAQLSAPALLPAPAAGAALVPFDQWSGWLNDAPHILIAGATNAGKTTIGKVATRAALLAGASGLVIDPKGKDWFGLPVIGAGRNFPAMLDMLANVTYDLDQRYQEYGKGKRDFDSTIVVVDEVPDIMVACTSATGRILDPRWSTFARSLGSLAREVRMRVILLSQSPLVEDIGMNSAMRSNYVRIALGDRIPLLINEDVDQKRREQLRKAYTGLAYPAAMLRRGQVYLLDTAQLPAISERPIERVAGYRPRVIQLAVETPEAAPVSREQATRKALAALKAKGYTRDRVRLEYPALDFPNKLWSEV